VKLSSSDVSDFAGSCSQVYACAFVVASKFPMYADYDVDADAADADAASKDNQTDSHRRQ